MKKINLLIATVAMLFIVLFLVSCNFTSCTSSPHTLKVISTSYPQLTELPMQEPDPEELKNVIFPDLYEYFGHQCHVSLDNGIIVISDTDTREQTHIFEGNYGYFLGVDLGEFGGHCKYYKYGITEPETVTDDNCFGLIGINNDTGYMISGTPNHFNSGKSNITKLIRDTDKDYWKCEEVTSFSGAPNCYVYSESDTTLYVSTPSSLLSIDLNNGEITELSIPEYWSYLFPNSMVIHKNKLLIGTVVGVFEYNLTTEQTAFYLINYAKYLGN